jgi:hypothetical protein
MHHNTSQVAPRVSQFYFASIATLLINAELPKLRRKRSSSFVKDNPPLYECHIAFLMRASLYLSLPPTGDDEHIPALRQLLGTIVENGPFHDLTYLAYMHADSSENIFDRRKQLEAAHNVWRDWYTHQCSNRPSTGVELEAIIKALAEFRLALPTRKVDLRATDDSEMEYARKSADAVFDSDISSLERQSLFPGWGDHEKWIKKMNRRLDRLVRQELYIKSK